MGGNSATRALLLLVVCACVLLACSPSLSPTPHPPEQGVLSSSDPAWIGGDGTFSIPLGEQRRLWLFGDTWLSVGGGRLAMVSNTLGIQVGPCETTFQPLWRDGEAEPRPFLASEDGVGWLWPAGAVWVETNLYLFYHCLVRRPPGGPWDFVPRGTELLRVKNPRAPPRDWIMERSVLPWAADAFLVGSYAVEGEHLLAFGSRPKGDGRELVLARIALADIKGLGTDPWEFLADEDPPPRWVGHLGEAKGLFQGVGTEFSVGRDPSGDGWLCVYSPGGISPEIHVRQATKVWGAWDSPKVIYRCPEADLDPGVYCYGAKHHPQCGGSGGSRLWITYSVNAKDGSLPRGSLPKPRWISMAW